jgi:hypothetical protein
MKKLFMCLSVCQKIYVNLHYGIYVMKCFAGYSKQ